MRIFRRWRIAVISSSADGGRGGIIRWRRAAPRRAGLISPGVGGGDGSTGVRGDGGDGACRTQSSNSGGVPHGEISHGSSMAQFGCGGGVWGGGDEGGEFGGSGSKRAAAISSSGERDILAIMVMSGAPHPGREQRSKTTDHTHQTKQHRIKGHLSVKNIKLSRRARTSIVRVCWSSKCWSRRRSKSCSCRRSKRCSCSRSHLCQTFPKAISMDCARPVADRTLKSRFNRIRNVCRFLYNFPRSRPIFEKFRRNLRRRMSM